METITIRTNKGFIDIQGYIINKKFNCYKSEDKELGYVIVDAPTGLLLVSGIKRVDDCYKNAKDIDWSYLDDKKNTKEYKKAVKDLEEYKKKAKKKVAKLN